MMLVRLAAAALIAFAATPPAAAAPEKALHMYLSTSETGLDPAVASDLATLALLENVFDPLLRYDYLARPARLRGNTALAMPEVSADGLAYTFRIRPGIYFTPDPAFGGKRRALTAHDYIYSLKRIYDPRIKSPWLPLLQGKLAGDEALARQPFSYDTAIPGLQAPDRHTLRIRLNAPENNFLFYLAMPATGAVAREVIEAHPGQAGNHPVGTGPFRVGEWKRSDRIVLERNPDSTAVFGTESTDPADQEIASRLKGKRLPLVDRVEVRIAEEFQGRMLGFLNGEYDYIEQVPESMRDMVMAGDALRPELAARGMKLYRFPTLQTYYMWMNMEDPVIGGYSREKVALRRAIALSYNGAEDVRLLKKNLAVRAQSPLAPNVIGYDPDYRSPVRYDPALARALLDRFGYTGKDPDGFRRDPQGRPLTLVMHSEATVGGRLRDELWRKSLNAIGLRVEFRSDKKTEIIKASRLGKVQMFESNWFADFPDGENFYQLLYGGNRGRANYARFNLPAYNLLYEQSRMLPDSPERRRMYFEMNQLIHAYNPWVPLTHPISADIIQSWLKNYKRHPVEFTQWRYLDIDPALREQSRRASP